MRSSSGSRGELVQQRGAREGALGELREGPLTRDRIGRAAQDEAEGGVDEILVARLRNAQVGLEARVHLPVLQDPRPLLRPRCPAATFCRNNGHGANFGSPSPR